MDTTLTLCYFFTAVSLPVIGLSFVVPSRDHPPLDWAFIWNQFAISWVVIFLLARMYTGWDNAWSDLARLFAWLNIVAAECAVLYFIYRERYGPGYLRRAVNLVIQRIRERVSG